MRVTRKVFPTRKFGGKEYIFHSFANTESQAKSIATSQRKLGKKAKVTPAKDIREKTYYEVWVA